ncbi:hypothetical protein T492DRAFT_876379, partial [Pavlovales sp. CCMP2436]
MLLVRAAATQAAKAQLRRRRSRAQPAVAPPVPFGQRYRKLDAPRHSPRREEWALELSLEKPWARPHVPPARSCAPVDAKARKALSGTLPVLIVRDFASTGAHERAGGTCRRAQGFSNDYKPMRYTAYQRTPSRLMPVAVPEGTTRIFVNTTTNKRHKAGRAEAGTGPSTSAGGHDSPHVDDGEDAVYVFDDEEAPEEEGNHAFERESAQVLFTLEPDNDDGGCAASGGAGECAGGILGLEPYQFVEVLDLIDARDGLYPQLYEDARLIFGAECATTDQMQTLFAVPLLALWHDRVNIAGNGLHGICDELQERADDTLARPVKRIS